MNRNIVFSFFNCQVAFWFSLLASGSVFGSTSDHLVPPLGFTECWVGDPLFGTSIILMTSVLLNCSSEDNQQTQI